MRHHAYCNRCHCCCAAPCRLLEELLQKEKEYQQVLKTTLQQRTHDLELVKVRHRPPGKHTHWLTDWLFFVFCCTSTSSLDSSFLQTFHLPPSSTSQRTTSRTSSSLIGWKSKGQTLTPSIRLSIFWLLEHVCSFFFYTYKHRQSIDVKCCFKLTAECVFCTLVCAGGIHTDWHPQWRNQRWPPLSTSTVSALFLVSVKPTMISSHFGEVRS